MQPLEQDTIFALTTPPGRSGVAVTRVSGPRAFEAVEILTSGPVPQRRRAVLRRLVEPGSRRVIDEALVLAFCGPDSFTGENIVEFQTHGSPAVCRMLFASLDSLEGFRPAEAGEFTRRALENDRIRLSQVEGLGELLAAETEVQHAQAQRLIDGQLDALAQRWRGMLLEAAAYTYAAIDFTDEDIPVDLLQEVDRRLTVLAKEMHREVEGTTVAERIRDGFTVALVGKPNVGKSTLMNALVRREVVLTSEVAGTTRDVIEAQIDLGGIPVTLLDMAGLHPSEDVVERLGIERARTRADAADVRVFLLEAPYDPGDLEVAFCKGDIIAHAKSDLSGTASPPGLSGRTGDGIERLLEQVRDELLSRSARVGVATNTRQGNAIRSAIGALDAARDSLAIAGPGWELAAQDIEMTENLLDELVGKIGVEDALGVIFRNFCIGK